MAHLLTDCLDLLRTAWNEVRVKGTLTADKRNKLNALLEEIGCTIEYKNAEDFKALKQILIRKFTPYNSPFSAWKSCKNLYNSLLMLLNSNYKKYDILDIGDAEKYLNQAIPLYCKLSGEEPPKINNHKINFKEQLKNGDILNTLRHDIPGIHIMISKEEYLRSLNTINKNGDQAIARKGTYIVYLKDLRIHPMEKGIAIENTHFALILVNEKTHNELTIKNYSDIKRILSKR